MDFIGEGLHKSLLEKLEEKFKGNVRHTYIRFWRDHQRENEEKYSNLIAGICVARGDINGERFFSISICNPEDRFSYTVGKRIAYDRLTKGDYSSKEEILGELYKFRDQHMCYTRNDPTVQLLKFFEHRSKENV